MSTWDELVGSALLGTERRPPPEARLDGAVAAVVEGLPPGSAEGTLLRTAAVLAIHRRAGRRAPRRRADLPAPAGAEDRRRCGGAASVRLAVILAEQPRAVLQEWLRELDASGLRVPEERLPELLELGRAPAGPRDELAPVLGERGRWLAALNPRWEWAGAAAGDEVWHTAATEARRLWLRARRCADPGAGRTALESTWPTEDPQARAAFVGELANGLSGADEPFLERALDDRRQDVRRAAAELLARLAQSALAGRMAQRTVPLARLEGTLRRRIVFELPGDCDAGMVRDGIVAKPPTGAGRRAWWLSQMIAATPLAAWEQAFERGPADITGLTVADDLGGLAYGGWATAAVRQGNTAWADELLATAALDEPGLLDAATPARAEAFLADVLRRDGPTGPSFTAIAHGAGAWGPALSRAVVDALAKQAAAGGPGLRLEAHALRLDPSVLPHATRAFASAEPGPAWASALTRLLNLLQFRHDMLEELR